MAFPWLKSGAPPPNKGKPQSEAWRRKHSETRRRMAAEGWKPGNYGKKMNYTPEHVEKLRANLQKAMEVVRKRKDGESFQTRTGHYRQMKVPKDSPHRIVCNNSGYAAEHRVIAARALGRSLKRDEVVHHINGDKTDNRHQNLLICSNAYNRWLHERMAAIYQWAMFGGKS